MTETKKPELLIPASSLEVLKTAVIFGADAVYIGGEAVGLRAKAKNFTMEEMAEGIVFAHSHGGLRGYGRCSETRRAVPRRGCRGKHKFSA